MNRKQQFLQAVQLLAPNDRFVYQRAQCVPEESLPARPGGAALEFVVAMQRFRRAGTCRFYAGRRRRNPQPESPASRLLSLSHALRVKGAEYWLQLGQPAQAIVELRKLPEAAQRHPAVVKALVAAARALREMGEFATAC